MSEENFVKPEKELFGYSLGMRLAMFTNVPDIEGGTATLRWEFRDGNPRITVWFRDPAMPENVNFVTAAMDPDVFGVLIENIRNIAKEGGREEYKNMLPCYGNLYENNLLVSKRSLKAEVWYGRNKEGLIWISVNAPGKPRAVFTFAMSTWHDLYNAKGDKYSEADLSCMMAISKMNTIEKVCSGILVKYAMDSEYKVKNVPRTFTTRSRSNKPVEVVKETPAATPSKSGMDFLDDDISY